MWKQYINRTSIKVNAGTSTYPLVEDEYTRTDVLGVLRRGICKDLLGSGYDLRWQGINIEIADARKEAVSTDGV